MNRGDNFHSGIRTIRKRAINAKKIGLIAIAFYCNAGGDRKGSK